jgi:hypothetical protein
VLGTSKEPLTGVCSFESNGFLRDATMDAAAKGIITSDPLV